MAAVTIYALKPRFQALLRPAVRRLAAAGITANQVTVATLLGSLAIGLLTALECDRRWPFLSLPVWLMLRMALNAADGMLAREYAQKSRLGACLNEIGDVASDVALYAPFALVAPFASTGVWLVVVLSVLSEFAGILGPSIGASRRYDGPLGKSDRALVFGVLSLWVGSGAALPDWLNWSMPLLAALLVLTIVNRLRAGLGEAAARDVLPSP